MSGFLAAALALVVGFFLGASAMSDSWEAGAKRGVFEVGHVVYVAKPLRSTLQGTVCAQDIPGVLACTSGASK